MTCLKRRIADIVGAAAAMVGAATRAMAAN